MGKIIGRKKEIDELMDIDHRNESQLVAVYGRRRVGKTFLIRELFKDKFAFYHTGLSPSELLATNLLGAQLEAFASSLKRYGYNSPNPIKNWMEAFDCLSDLPAFRRSLCTRQSNSCKRTKSRLPDTTFCNCIWR